MPPRSRCTRVVVQPHAYQRYRERGGQGELTSGAVARRLFGLLPLGVEAQDLRVRVPLGGELYAICLPDIAGGWVCVTVIREGERAG
jgi:hypothetical protein